VTPDPDDDARFMALALALSREGLGQTWPNPSVGAVVVRQSATGPVIVGQGVTQAGGRPHGEAMALAEAGDAAAAATLYVALEPCSYSSIRGGTPCVERSLKAGITRVVSAIEDPNPRIAGLGHALLRSAGIRVDVVTFKVARTADGYAGGPGRERVAISCAEAGLWVHRQRSEYDAIMVGIDTVLADDPQLNVRLPGLEWRSPVRVVLDTRLRMPATIVLAKTARDIPTWVIAADDAPTTHEAALVAAGVEVIRVGRGSDGHLDLRAALALLATRGITRVFSEGGPTVGEQLALQGLADEVIVSTAPVVMGREGITAVRPALAALLAEGRCFALARQEMIGHDSFAFYERID
jgi:diaminohydroxyphosphoribosylaminopyrimidine deaminase/5-amino-6-(5-phosphoribosylamino)uracil reductase